jgi:hypothetical protein
MLSWLTTPMMLIGVLVCSQSMVRLFQNTPSPPAATAAASHEARLAYARELRDGVASPPPSPLDPRTRGGAVTAAATPGGGERMMAPQSPEAVLSSHMSTLQQQLQRVHERLLADHERPADAW